MIIQALVKRYHDAGGAKQGWQPRLVDFAIHLDRAGNVLRITDIRIKDGNKKQRQEMLLPVEPAGRTSGIKAAFLCDNDKYLFGNDAKRGDAMFEAAARLHNEVLSDVNTETAIALKAFFSSKPNGLDLPRDGETDKGAFCVFIVNGKYAHECEEACAAWDAYHSRECAQTAITFDLVSGEYGHVEDLHGSVSLPGVTMGKKPLISVNAESFVSYGSTMKDPAAGISKTTAHQYVDALNALLKSDVHKKRFAQDTIVYWAEEGGEVEAETFSWFMEPKEDDTGKLDAALLAITDGTAMMETDMNRRFHILCLSPNAGRISVRFFHSDNFGNSLNRIAKHYENLEIYAAPGKKPEKFPHIPPWILLSETTVKKSSSDAAPLLAGQLLKSIVTGTRYPLTLYHAILTRIRAGEEINRTKAAIVKAVLQRNYESEVATVALNKDSNHIPYTLGRLFSVLDAAQASAGNTGMRERYFSKACANPASAFPSLLKLSMHHSSKSDYGRYYEIQKADLIGRLDSETPFPATLNEQEQGEFIVGYYHQQQDEEKEKQDRIAKKKQKLQEDTTND